MCWCVSYVLVCLVCRCVLCVGVCLVYKCVSCVGVYECVYVCPVA